MMPRAISSQEKDQLEKLVRKLFTTFSGNTPPWMVITAFASVLGSCIGSTSNPEEFLETAIKIVKKKTAEMEVYGREGKLDS
jgi:hypothetical protein